jgi:hypothetical protein
MLNAAQSVGIAQRLVGKGGEFSAAWLPMALEYERMQGFFNSPPLSFGEIVMGNKIVTEADRKRTPRPVPPNGYAVPTGGRGQRVSLERGVHTRFKKNPGKRHG